MWLTEENARRSRKQPEFELLDTGVLSEDRYFDVFVEYAKADTEDILIRITAANRGPERATLHVLPTLWFRNTWSWGRTGEGYWPKPKLWLAGNDRIGAEHVSLGKFELALEAGAEPLFTENETNLERLFAYKNAQPYVKDAFHEYVIHGRHEAINPQREGTKAAGHYQWELAAGESRTLHLRLSATQTGGDPPDQIFDRRIREADEFYDGLLTCGKGASPIAGRHTLGFFGPSSFSTTR